MEMAKISFLWCLDNWPSGILSNDERREEWERKAKRNFYQNISFFFFSHQSQEQILQNSFLYNVKN
jgi:hypothetical protein